MTIIESIVGSASTGELGRVAGIASGILAQAADRFGGVDVAALLAGLAGLAKQDTELASQVRDAIIPRLTIMQQAEFEHLAYAPSGEATDKRRTEDRLLTAPGGHISTDRPRDPLVADVGARLDADRMARYYNSLIRKGGGERRMGPFLIQGGTAQVREVAAQALEKVLSTSRGQDMTRGAEATKRLERIILTDARDVSQGDYVLGVALINYNVAVSSPPTFGKPAPPLEATIAHELGHVIFRTLDDGPARMNNTNLNENPVRAELGLPLRTRY